MSKKCPKCKKTVYAAECLQSVGQWYHRGCFKCESCSRPLTQGKQKEREENIYCELCFNKNFSVIGSGAAVSKPGSIGGDKCPVCNKAVYQAEEVKTQNFKYHPSCFVCYECKSHLTLGKQKEKESNVYCDLCFNKKFSIIGSGSAVAQPGSVGVGDKCPVCNKAVYQAEEVKTQNFKYHPSCFVCYECKSHLTLGKQKEKEGNVYCDLCFNKKFSIIGSGSVVAQPGSVGVGDKCAVCNKTVYQAEEVKTEKFKYHPSCFICFVCKSHLTLGKQKEKEGNVYCDLCFNKKFSIIGSGTAVAQPGSVGVGEKCAVCNKTVYQAEEVKTEKFKYHPSCFICFVCKSHLTLGKQQEKEGYVYCELCFNKKFSIIGSGTTVAQPGSIGVGDKCHVCNKTVYQAEEVKTEKFKYHPSCFLCHVCKSRLTLGKQQEKEGNVYCDLCFNKKFSIIGSGAAVAKPGSMGEGEKCPVCNKSVFQAEQVKTEIFKYHQNCFVCHRCKSYLVLGKQREKDNRLYCENCYNGLFRIAGYGQITGLTSHVLTPPAKQDEPAGEDVEGAGQAEAATAAAAAGET